MPRRAQGTHLDNAGPPLLVDLGRDVEARSRRRRVIEGVHPGGRRAEAQRPGARPGAVPRLVAPVLGDQGLHVRLAGLARCVPRVAARRPGRRARPRAGPGAGGAGAVVQAVALLHLHLDARRRAARRVEAAQVRQPVVARTPQNRPVDPPEVQTAISCAAAQQLVVCTLGVSQCPCN